MGFAMRHHGESRTETGNGSALSSITRTDMDTKKTTLAELIDAFVAADRPASLGASALSRLAYWRTAPWARTPWPPDECGSVRGATVDARHCREVGGDPRVSGQGNDSSYARCPDRRPLGA